MDWRRIWSLKAQEQIKMFMWPMEHDKFLTNYSRWHRHLSSTPYCDQCEAVEEDALHAIRDCKSSKEVWQWFIPLILQQNFFSQSLTRLAVDDPRSKMAGDNDVDLLERVEVWRSLREQVLEIRTQDWADQAQYFRDGKGFSCRPSPSREWKE